MVCEALRAEEKPEYSGRALGTLKEFGLTAEHIAKAAKDIVVRK